MKSENISAAAALNKIADIKQFKLLEDYSYLAAMESVKRVNDEAVSTIGIDLLNSNNLSMKQIEIYENFLERFIDKNLSVRYSDSFLDDQLELIRTVEDFPTHSFRSFGISQETLTQTVKDSLKQIGIIAPAITPIIKDALRVQRYVIDKDMEVYLSLSQVTVKSKSYYILFHTNVGITRYTKNKLNQVRKFDDFFKFSNPAESNSFRVITCFLVDCNSPLANSPVHMFFNSILKYGKSITIDNTTKKFFLKGRNSNLLIRQGGEIMFNNGSVKGHGFNIFLEKTDTGYKYAFAYMIDRELLLRGFNTRNIL